MALDGVLRIFVNDTLTNEIEDELPAMVKNLCFSISRDLQHHDRAVYHFFSYWGQIDFVKQGDKISVAGTGINTTMYDAHGLLAALHNCGERFVAMLQQLKDTIEDPAPLISTLKSIELPQQK